MINELKLIVFFFAKSKRLFGAAGERKGLKNYKRDFFKLINVNMKYIYFLSKLVFLVGIFF